MNLLQHLGQLQGVVRDENIGAGAFDGGGCLENDSFAFDPAGACGGFDHCVLSADLISGQRHIELLASARNDIEVCQRRFDHDDVHAFFDIERAFGGSI